MTTVLSTYGQILRLALTQAEAPFEVCLTSAKLDQFEALQPRAEEFLSAEELAFFRSRQFPKKQHSYLLGRFAGKLALGDFLKESDWSKIDIHPGVFEQPLVRCKTNEAPGVTITHCDDLAMALAFPLTHPMGIDVERIDAAMVPTMKSQMCVGEIAWAKGDEGTRCALIWTAKEALSKALKCGLTTSFALLEVEQLQPLSEGAWRGIYRHFKQYHCFIYATERHALSITMPTQLSLPAGTDLRALIT